MRSVNYILACTVVILAAACHSDDPFISKQQAEALLKAKEAKPVEYVTAIVGNDVYWIRNFDNTPRKITNSTFVEKKHVRLSHDRAKIAFADNSGHIIVIDTTGNPMTTATMTGDIISMDWSGNDKTLWMLINGEIKFNGPAMNLPELEYDFGEEVISAAVTSSGSLLYIVRSPSGIGTYTERLEIRGPAGSMTVNKQEGEIRHMETVRLSKDGENFVIGYSRSPGDDYLVKMGIYPLGEEFPTDEYETDSYIDPVFDVDSDYIVMAVSENENEFYLTAFYTKNEAFGDDKSKYKFDYSAEAGSIYVDWK